MGEMSRILLAGTALLLGSEVQHGHAFQAGSPSGEFSTGRVIEHVPAADGSSGTFALYVPTSYSSARRWPLVLILDPRGRGATALRPLVPAAERLGYVLASSDETASDVDGDPNTPAVNAILATLQPRLSIDDRRFYLFGMSGTARAAWALGYAARPHVAGVAGFGAGPPPDMDLESAHEQYGAPFVFYGGAGEADFNHAELVLLEGRLRRLGFRFTTAFYPGPHGWPRAEEEFDAALAWMHWMSMRVGLVDADSVWLEAEYARRLASAARLETVGEIGAAWRAYDQLAADADGVLPRGAAAERAAALRDDGRVATWRARRLELARSHVAYEERMAAWLRDTQTGQLPELPAALTRLRVDSLRALAADNARADQAEAADRALADLFSLTSFYYPRYYAARKQWERARLMLEIAEVVRPGTPAVRRQLDRVSAELGRGPQVP